MANSPHENGSDRSLGSPVEVEWQFDATDMGPVEQWLGGLAGTFRIGDDGPVRELAVVPRRPKRLSDTYLDTEDWRVGRAGYTLRIRRRGSGGEVTLKSRTPAEGGLRTRAEITEPLPADGIESVTADGPVGSRLRSIAGPRALRPVIEVRTTRRPYDLQVGGKTVAEVALDDTAVRAGAARRPARLRRVEVEVAPAWVEALTPLVDRLRSNDELRPAALSKFEAGLSAGGLQIPGAPDLGPTQLSATSTLGEVAYAVLRRNVVAMLVHEPGTRLGEDHEDLHDMRVATRRMRAAFSLFADALPAPAEHLRAELGWLGGELGPVRDLDVQLERLEEWASEVPEEDRGTLDELARLLEQERREARATLLTALESDRYERLVADLTQMLRDGPPPRSAAARAPALAVVPDLVEARHRAATKAARRARASEAAEDFHRLRIRCKRLRYALEFVSDLYDARTRKMVRRVQRLQDLLGRMQDARVAVDRLHNVATSPESALPARTVFVMGGIAERYRLDAAQIAAKLPAQLERLAGGPWKKLRTLMEHRRLAVGAPYHWSPSAHPHPGAPDTASRGAESRSGWPVATEVSLEQPPSSHDVRVAMASISETPSGSRVPVEMSRDPAPGHPVTPP